MPGAGKPPAWEGEPIPLGPFSLIEPLGLGGGAEVWRALPVGGGPPVAVKVMIGPSARTPSFVSAFRREIQTAAGLDHPAIVLLLDHGEVTPEAAVASRGRLVAGSPYLVMELATGGTLSDRVRTGALPWEEARQILLTLLDALAHAHARGVIHRDVKPDNLLRLHRDVGASWALADFGIAHALASGASGEEATSVVGTPGYMAPEQVRGEPRAYGPWTDLFAVGCIAHVLLWGNLPFPFGDFPRYVTALLTGAPPALAPPAGCPWGVERWVRRLLASEPADRFRRAADAAYALRSLSEELLEDDEGEADHTLRVYPRPFQAVEEMTTERQDATTLQLPPVEIRGPGVRTPGWDPAPVAPPPATWRREVEGRAPSLLGAGLRLYGLRTIPVVGRDRERDLLWQALLDVTHDRRARGVLARGAAGTGKSRLAEWFCERAHEVGAATVLYAAHEAHGEEGDALVRMVARELGVGAGPVEEEAEWARKQLERLGLTDAEVLGGVVDLLVGARAVAPDERSALIQRVLRLMAGARPVVVWIDDGHFSPESLSFAHNVLDEGQRGGLPVLVLLTLRDGGEGEVRQRVSRLEQHPAVTVLPVDPLSDAAQRALVRALLDLPAELMDTVVVWSGGLPLAAVQLVGAWVQQGLLEPGERSLRLRSGCTPELPPSLQRMWADRLEQLLAARPATDRIALELSAALGLEVALASWSAVCRSVGVGASMELVEALVSRRLARWREGGFALVHGTLRDALEAGAREGGRWRDHHRACARWLEGREARVAEAWHAERLAHHLLEAGELRRALGPLLTASRDRWRWGDLRISTDFTERREHILRAFGMAGSREWLEGLLQRARVEMTGGDLPAAAGRLREVEAVAVARGWRDLAAEALLSRAYLAYRAERLGAATSLYERAVVEMESLGRGVQLGDALLGLGDVARRQGEARRAQSLYARALGRYREAEHPGGMARCLHSMAALLQNQEPDRARELFERAMVLNQHLGNRMQAMACLNGLADADRLEGALDSAEARYRRVLGFYEVVGSTGVHVVRFNLAVTLLMLHRPAEARDLLLQSVGPTSHGGQTWLAGGIHVALTACSAALGDWSAFDHHLAEASERLNEASAPDRDDAWPAEQAARLAWEAGQGVRARHAYELAAFVWGRLGDVEAVARIREVVSDAVPPDLSPAPRLQALS